VGGFLAWNVLSQPRSRRSSGLNLVFDTAWSGIIYGLVDSVLLSIMPVQIILLSFPEQSNISLIFYGLLASITVTILYHVGFKEFRNKSVLKPVIGNSLCTLAFLITGNAVAAIISHIIMHIASVLHGPENKKQLPPHYPDDSLRSNQR
jgi:hypothetical protein